jgi:hypothetical protein
MYGASKRRPNVRGKHFVLERPHDDDDDDGDELLAAYQVA